MESNYLSPVDVMSMTKHQCSRGMAATGLGLAAGALALGVAGWLGLNAASKARAKAAEVGIAANQNALNMVSQFLLQERTSRESYQLANAPTIRQYVDVQAGAGAGSLANANALATAYALQNGGLNSAVANESYIRVMPFSAPKSCCDPCNG